MAFASKWAFVVLCTLKTVKICLSHGLTVTGYKHVIGDKQGLKPEDGKLKRSRKKTNSASLALVLRSYRKRYVLSITYPLSVGTHGLKTVSLRRDAYACSKTLIPLSPVGTREVKTVSLRRNAYKPSGQRL